MTWGTEFTGGLLRINTIWNPQWNERKWGQDLKSWVWRGGRTRQKGKDKRKKEKGKKEKKQKIHLYCFFIFTYIVIISGITYSYRYELLPRVLSFQPAKLLLAFVTGQFPVMGTGGKLDYLGFLSCSEGGRSKTFKVRNKDGLSHSQLPKNVSDLHDRCAQGEPSHLAKPPRSLE